MFDNISKFLAEQYPEDFASWLIGESMPLTELSPSELSLEPIRADALILLESNQVVLHCEFQTEPDPTMPFRMADYALRIYRRFPQKRLVQVVIYLRSTTSAAVHQTSFSGNNLRHEFQVIRLWEQPTEIFFQKPGLLPYAVLSQTSDRAKVLKTVANQVETLTDRRQQSNLAAAAGVLAGLVLEKALIQRLMRREIMRESVIYQDWLQEIEAEVREKLNREMEEAREEARREMEEAREEARRETEEARQEARREEGQSLVRRLLTRRVGELPAELRSQVQALSIEELESLGEALLDFQTIGDLEVWLRSVA